MHSSHAVTLQVLIPAVVRLMNMERELSLLAHGRATHAFPDDIATWALAVIRNGGVSEPVRGDEVLWLKTLFALEDPRHA